MKTDVLIFLIMILISCQESKQNKVATKQKAYNVGYNYEAVELKKWRKEHFSVDSVSLGGKIWAKTKLQDLYNLLGKPRKVVPIPINRNNGRLLDSCTSENGAYLYYGGTIFEKYGDKVILNTIDFESTDIPLISKGDTLKKGLRPIDVQKKFRESGRMIAGTGYLWSGTMFVPASEHEEGLNKVWILVFKSERLSKAILYSFPELNRGSQSVQVDYGIDTNAVLLREWNQEYLHYDSILINGKVPLVTNIKDLTTLFGKPHLITQNALAQNNCLMFGRNTNKAQFLMYGNTIFEQLNGNIIVNTIDFESTDVELVNSKITLKKGTTPSEIQRVFPESCLLSGFPSQKAWTGTIILSAHKATLGGLRNIWFLVFKEEKLAKVVLFLGGDLVYNKI